MRTRLHGPSLADGTRSQDLPKHPLMLVMRMICEDSSISRWGYLPMELEGLKCPFWCRV